jgi:hypothetical protein
MRTAAQHTDFSGSLWYLGITLVGCWAGLFCLLYRALR